MATAGAPAPTSLSSREGGGLDPAALEPRPQGAGGRGSWTPGELHPSNSSILHGYVTSLSSSPPWCVLRWLSSCPQSHCTSFPCPAPSFSAPFSPPLSPYILMLSLTYPPHLPQPLFLSSLPPNSLRYTFPSGFSPVGITWGSSLPMFSQMPPYSPPCSLHSFAPTGPSISYL